jgi:HAUS augmin-like complex subunit 2
MPPKFIKIIKFTSTIFQDDKNIAHLTHVNEMEKKCESLARITSILKDVIQNKVTELPELSLLILSYESVSMYILL